MDQADFAKAINDNPYQLIIDSTTFDRNTTWIKPPNDAAPYPERVDRVDYVRFSPVDSYTTAGAIGQKYSENPWLGNPISAETDVQNVAGARVQQFENGVVYWSISTGAHYLKGAIRSLYEATPGTALRLGLPTSDENVLSAGVAQVFQRGQIHWAGTTGAQATYGAIQAYWSRNGWETGWLGYPTGPEIDNLKGGGASQSFQGGTVFWNGETGTTAAVKGATLKRFGQLGFESGRLGYPVTDEFAVPGGTAQIFDNGQIHWQATAGAWETLGAIQSRWSSFGWQSGKLGFPTGPEITGLKDGGASQTFQGGTLFWSPRNSQANLVKAGNLARYAQLGYENGSLGYPTSDEFALKNGSGQTFEGGQLHFSPQTGSWDTRGAIQSYWASQGWENGWLGFPKSGEQVQTNGLVRQVFSGGVVVWSASSGISASPSGT